MRLLYWARDLTSGAQFGVLRRFSRGSVLDVGGWDFVETAIRRGVTFERWTTLELDPERLLDSPDPRVTTVHGDGCAMTLPDASFDTVVNLQVLEHVFEPLRMVREVSRVLKPDGHAIFLIPQNSTVHLAPSFYGNFSRFWIDRAMSEAGLEIVEYVPIGGVWSSAASRFVYFFLQAARIQGMTDTRVRRNRLFFVMVPLQFLWALINIPVCLLLSLGDLAEEPNGHLVVARHRKPVSAA